MGQEKPTYDANFTYPDSVTVAPIWYMNGSNQYMTTQGASFSELYTNIWFYPTGSGCILMTVQSSYTENAGYHYSALEINGNLTVTGGFWNGASITTVTSTDTIVPNDWNHIYFRQNANEILLQVNGGTAVTVANVWSPPGNLVIGFGTTSVTNSGNSARFPGRLAEFRMNSTNTASNYMATRSKYEAPQPFIYDDFTIEWWQKAENIGQNTRPWAIGLLGSPTGQVVSLSYEGNGRDYFWINNTFPAQLADRPLKNHYGIGWEHMAIVRENNQIKLYSNGVNYMNWSGGGQALTATDAELVVGTGELAAGNFQGYIKDLHIVKGYAKYTANFTPPTAPVQPQLGSVFLLPAMSSGTVFDDVVGNKTANPVNTPTYSEDDPFTYPGATFTAAGYGNNLITPSPMPADLRAGLLVSDGAGWSDYIIDPNYFGNIQLSSLPASTPPGLVYTVSEDLTSITRTTNTYGGNSPSTYTIDFSGIYFTPELLKVRAGWKVYDGATLMGSVRTNAYVIAEGTVRINVDFNPALVGGLTFLFQPPAYGGSIRFDVGDRIGYGSSVDWAFDVDAIESGSLNMHLDANNFFSYNSSSGSTWYDLTGNAANIALYNAPYWDNGPPGYLNFDGVSQYGVGSTANMVPQAAYTKMVWFRVNSLAADNNLVSSSAGGHFMFLAGGNRLWAGHANVPPFSGPGAFGSTSTFAANTWYCATVTFSVANGIRLYINGTLDASDPTYQTPHNGNGSVNVGCFAPNGNLLNGRLGQVLCYGTELTAQQVLKNFNATRSRYGI